MANSEPWDDLTEAIEFAASCIVDDPDPLNDRELADGQQYVMRILRTVAETSLVTLDFDRPSFLPMFDSVRHLGAAGPDIDYDVAILSPGESYRITGRRGDAGYVGIVVYGASGAEGASSILAAVDVDDFAGPDGTFTFDVDQPAAARVIVRQYFHDRSSETRGSWTIERLGGVAPATAGDATRADPGIVGHQIANGASTLRWNAQLNRLWTPERRAHANEFIRLAAEDIVAAVPNPDVTYAFSWWRVDEGEALLIDVEPPNTRYWAVQVCDRWFQSYPQRRTNLNDRQVAYRDDGSVRCVLADRDPGVDNWLDTGGHHTGVVFFRWLHADPPTLPTCRIVTTDQIG
ncbi:MAG: hypothetical protein DHS20C19_08610 [Acidimicrobiales bacterium]|nr:MAG: hypothetical protein DHS20C19_08610 [Acidimicrobiales bacterium]